MIFEQLFFTVSGNGWRARVLEQRFLHGELSLFFFFFLEEEPREGEKLLLFKMYSKNSMDFRIFLV